MVSDWIKMRTDLYRDPKVIVISNSILRVRDDGDGKVTASVTRNVMRNAVVGALVTLWGTARHQGDRIGDDLVMEGITIEVIDEIAELPGLGAAMAVAGWLEETGKGVVLPCFFESNNEELPKRAKTGAERQREYRERKRLEKIAPQGGVTKRDACDDREREEREKSIERERGGAIGKSRIPESLRTAKFAEIWNKYRDWSLAISGKRFNEIKGEMTLADLCRRGHDKAIADLKLTMQMSDRVGRIWDSDLEKARGAPAAGADKRSKIRDALRKSRESK